VMPHVCNRCSITTQFPNERGIVFCTPRSYNNKGLSRYSLGFFFISSPLFQVIQDIDQASAIKDMCSWLDRIPTNNLTHFIAVKLCPTNNPLLRLRIVRCNGTPTALATPTPLPGLFGYFEEVKVLCVRFCVSPSKV